MTDFMLRHGADPTRAAGIEEGTMRGAVHRLRKRYRLLLRDEITQTLSDPSQVNEEMRSLQAAPCCITNKDTEAKIGQ